MLLFDLTPMTGKDANAERTHVIGTVEMRRRVAIIGIVGLLVSVFVGLILWPFIGSAAILVPFAVIPAALLMFDYRSETGMKLRTYQKLTDRYRARPRLGVVTVCGKPFVFGDQVTFVHLVHSSVPAGAPAQLDQAAGSQSQTSSVEPDLDSLFS